MHLQPTDIKVQNLPLIFSVLTGVTLIVTTLCNTVLANKHLTVKLPKLPVFKASNYLGATLTRIWVFVIFFAVIASFVIAPAAYGQNPALIALMLTPLWFGLYYGWRHYHRSRPHLIRRTITNSIRRAVRLRPRPHEKPVDDPTRRAYWRALLPSWFRLVLNEDKLVWTWVHQLVLLASALFALLAPARFGLTPFAGFAGAVGISLISYIRWHRIDRARKTTINAYYSVCSDKFKYPTAARNTTIQNRGDYASASGAISVGWSRLTDPEQVVAKFPITYEKTDMRKREEFETNWEATFPSAVVKRFEWNTGEGTVAIVPANYPENVRWAGRVEGDWDYFVVGLRLDNNEWIGFSVVKNAPHILVGGETGGGKTEVMFDIVNQAALKGWIIALCDPKTTGWLDYTQNLRYVNDPAEGFMTGAQPLQPGDARQGIVEHAVELFGIRDVINRTMELLETRKCINATYRAKDFKMLKAMAEQNPESVNPGDLYPPYLLVIDEALSLFSNDKGNDEQTKIRNSIRDGINANILRLIVEARALAIHIMLGLQRPDTAFFGGAARDQAGIRLAAGAMKEHGLKMMFDELDGIPRLPLQKDGKPGEVVRGRGQVRMGSGQPIVNVQYAWNGDEADDMDEFLPMPELPEGVTPNERPAERLDADPLENFSGQIKIDESGIKITGDNGQWTKPDGTPNVADSTGYMPPIAGANRAGAPAGAAPDAGAMASANSRVQAGSISYDYTMHFDPENPFPKSTFDPLEPPFFVHPKYVSEYVKLYKVAKTKVTFRDTTGEVMSKTDMQILYSEGGKSKYMAPIETEIFFDDVNGGTDAFDDFLSGFDDDMFTDENDTPQDEAVPQISPSPVESESVNEPVAPVSAPVGGLPAPASADTATDAEPEVKSQPRRASAPATHEVPPYMPVAGAVIAGSTPPAPTPAPVAPEPESADADHGFGEFSLDDVDFGATSPEQSVPDTSTELVSANDDEEFWDE